MQGVEFLLEGVAEWLCACGFEIGGVLAAIGSVVAALAHTGVVTQAALIKVWVRKGIRCRDTLVLHKGRKEYKYAALGKFPCLLSNQPCKM